jgi:hypothetical protein
MLASSTGWQLDDFGTAGALVAATVALIKERYPHLSPALVGRALAMFGSRVGLVGRRGRVVGRGRDTGMAPARPPGRHPRGQPGGGSP